MAVEDRQSLPWLDVDENADAAYIYFSNREVARTDPSRKPWIIDYDRDGNPVGLEILGISRLSEPPPSEELDDLVDLFIYHQRVNEEGERTSWETLKRELGLMPE